MPAFDLELIDPMLAAVEKALADAVETANLRCRKGLMTLDRGEYRKFLNSDFAAPQGVAIWLPDGRAEQFPPTPRATMLGVAWYTTPLGRKVVRIAGRRIEPFNEHPSARFGPPWRSWPALCHLDPDHVVTRTFAGGQPETIALCDCGAIGPPEKLGWMIGRCGPCHDHLEEHGTPLAAGASPSVLRTAGQLMRVGFLPLGQTVAAVEWTAPREAVKVAVWDRRTGACESERAKSSSRTVGAGRAATGLVLSGRFRLFWVGEAGQERAFAVPSPNESVAFAARGTMLATVGYNQYRCT